jgi:uncharacterized protein YcbX
VQVTELWRYPVKSMQGERVDAVDLTSWGLAGDRRWALFDLDTGFGLTARRLPELLHASARLRGDDDVEITLPDGTVAADDAGLSAWLGKRVALRATSEVGPRQYENPADIETEAEESWQPFDGTEHAFHDGFTVTLLSATTIGDRPMRRFRPNIVIDGGEDELVGRTIQVGGAVVDVTDGVPRCVMVTRSQPGSIEVDRDVLRWIHRQRDGELAVGGPVLREGAVRVGDEVTPV